MNISFLVIKTLVALINKDSEDFSLDVIKEKNGCYFVVLVRGSSDLNFHLELDNLTPVQCYWYLYGIFAYLRFGKGKDE